MSCSATLRRAAERFQHSARLISDSAAVEFDREGADGRLSVDLNTGGRQPIYQTIDTMLAGLFMLCEWILTVPITPIEVTFRPRKPADDRAYRAVFRCPLRYVPPLNSILFPADVLAAPVRAATEDLDPMMAEQ